MTKELPKNPIKEARMQAIMKSDEFMPEFDKQAKSIVIDNIPDNLQDLLHGAMAQYSFTAMNLPHEVYKDMVKGSPKDWSVGVVQKACNIILSAKSETDVVTYYYAIVSVIELQEHINTLLQTAKQNAIDNIHTRWNLSGRL
jgi:hypothetical protein